MNVEIGTEAAQFPEKEYINGIFLEVYGARMIFTFLPITWDSTSADILNLNKNLCLRLSKHSKGQFHEIFNSRFFRGLVSPQTLEFPVGP
jgi:hypothetical protein